MDINKIIDKLANPLNKNKGFQLYEDNKIIIQDIDLFEEEFEIYIKAKSLEGNGFDTSLYLSRNEVIGECTCENDNEEISCEHVCSLLYEVADYIEEDDNKLFKYFIDYLLNDNSKAYQEYDHKLQMINLLNDYVLEENYQNTFVSDTPKKIINTIGLVLEHTAINQKLYLTLTNNNKVFRIDKVKNFLECVEKRLPFNNSNSKLHVNSETFLKKSLLTLTDFQSLLLDNKNSDDTYYAYYQQNYIKLTKNTINWLESLEDVPMMFKGNNYNKNVMLSKIKQPIFSLTLEEGKLVILVNGDVTFDYINELFIVNLTQDKIAIPSQKKKNLIEMTLDFMDIELNYHNDKDVIDNLYYSLIKQGLCEVNNMLYQISPSVEYIFDVHGRNGVIEIYPYLKYQDKIINPLFEDILELDYITKNLSLSYLDKYQYVKLKDSYQIIDHFDIINFFNVQLSNLPDNFEVKLSEDINSVYIDDFADKIGLKVSFVNDLIQMDIDIDEVELKELKSIYDSIENNDSYYTLASGQLINIYDEQIITKFNYLKSMNVDVSRLNEKRLILPRYYSLFLANDNLAIKKDKSFLNLSDEIKQVKNRVYQLPNINAQLREYQIEGFKWLLSNYELGFGSILADDMGLGKTIQLITFLSYIYNDKTKKRTLILVPKALLYNWQHEFKKFNSELVIEIVDGDKEQRETILKQTKSKIILTTYDLFKRDFELYQDEIFECVVIDEAQAIKNDSTSISKAVKQLNTKNAIALSGTPIENNLLELFSLFEFILPGYLGSKLSFKRNYEKPIGQGNNQKMAQLLSIVNPFILRRSKKEVLHDLPDKIEETIQCELTKEQAKIYNSYFMQIKNKVEKEYINNLSSNRIEVLSLLTKLRQICCHPSLVDRNYTKESGKLETTIELIKNGLLGSNKILVFSQFTSMLSIIKDKLDKENIKYYYLDGKISSRQRLKLCDDFNASDEISVFLISLKAGGAGLNLTSANMVIHYDQWWNPALMNQASDRAHRYGQKNVVQVFNLVTRKTIEEKIMALQVDKKDLVAQVLSSNNTSLTKMSDEQLKGLFDI